MHEILILHFLYKESENYPSICRINHSSSCMREENNYYTKKGRKIPQFLILSNIRYNKSTNYHRNRPTMMESELSSNNRNNIEYEL